jgi:hypothetical protein
MGADYLESEQTFEALVRQPSPQAGGGGSSNLMFGVDPPPNGGIPYGQNGSYITVILAGTTNQVTVTPSGSTITFSLPQSIHTGATPTFAGLIINGSIIGGTQAIAWGRANIAYAADTNLTATSAQYKNRILDLSSTLALTATRDLVLPLTDSAIWIVRNLTTGGQSIRCIGASGTGVTIANGMTATIFADGTNICRATADV